jgi:hypothetical protein
LPKRAKQRQRLCVSIQAMPPLKNSMIVFRTTRPLSKLTLECDTVAAKLLLLQTQWQNEEA